MRFTIVNIIVVLISTFNHLYAQTGLASTTGNLFNKYPAELKISSAQVNGWFATAATNDSVTITWNGYVIKGQLVQKQSFSSDAQLISIQLTGFPANTNLTINRIQRDGNIIYRAQILNHKYPDAYVLKSSDANEFVFVKTEREKVVTD